MSGENFLVEKSLTTSSLPAHAFLRKGVIDPRTELQELNVELEGHSNFQTAHLLVQREGPLEVALALLHGGHVVVHLRHLHSA